MFECVLCDSHKVCDRRDTCLTVCCVIVIRCVTGMTRV